MSDKEDAERYRALRDPAKSEDGTVYAMLYVHKPGQFPHADIVKGVDLDIACDALIKRKANE